MTTLANNALPGTSVNRQMPLAGSFAVGRRELGRVDGLYDLRRRLAPSGPSDGVTIKSTVTVRPSADVLRQRVAWGGMAVETVNVTQHGRLEFRFRAPVHLLILLEAGARSDGETSVEGVPSSTLHDYQRKLIFVPAGHTFHDWQETRSLPRLAFFYFDPSALPLAAGTSLAPRLFFDDAELLKTALKLKAAVMQPHPRNRSYCEALGIVLAHDLARLASGARAPERHVRGGLAAWQQQTAVRHIDEHLAENVSLTTLAGLVRLSPYHFSRAFKQSFGMPPHRFHSHRRIERAKALLADPNMSVTQVGVVLGFGSSSSFTMAFRKVAGMTPSEYRRTAV
jgi:AraC family transcriptional regulator